MIRRVLLKKDTTSMKKLLLTITALTFVTAASPHVFAEDNAMNFETQTPYEQATGNCSETADQYEVYNENTGEGNWDELYKNCMEDAGFGESYEDLSDNDADGYTLDQ